MIAMDWPHNVAAHLELSQRVGPALGGVPSTESTEGKFGEATLNNLTADWKTDSDLVLFVTECLECELIQSLI